jgi:DNA-binding MarR family transcriptional regulator
VRSNITQLVDRLESDKLVRRVDDPKDRRSLRAAITPLGRERQALGAKQVEAVRRQLAGALKAIDGDALQRALADLTSVSKR